VKIKKMIMGSCAIIRVAAGRFQDEKYCAVVTFKTPTVTGNNLSSLSKISAKKNSFQIPIKFSVNVTAKAGTRSGRIM
jgi:hypothetical protein